MVNGALNWDCRRPHSRVPFCVAGRVGRARRFVWILAWAVCALASHAVAAGLSASLDRTRSTLGEPVILTVQAPAGALETLDTTPLDAAFDLAARTLSRGPHDDTLVLTLYPRASGRLAIPPLPAGSGSTAPLSLEVTPGSEAVPRVETYWTLTPPTPAINTPARLSLSVCDDGSLTWTRPQLPTAIGRSLRALSEDTASRGAGNTRSCQRYHWALLATDAGVAKLTVPMLDATRFGQRLRFPAASLAYRARELPAWLPAHVPALAPTVRPATLPARWPIDRPLSWQFEVLGAYSAADLKALLETQLRASSALAVYPPLVEPFAPTDAASPLLRFRVTLLFLPRETGPLTMPTLQLPWYDLGRGVLASTSVVATPVPAAGATSTSRAEPAHLVVFDPRWQWLTWGLFGIAALVLVALGGWRLRVALRWRRARRAGLQRLQAADDSGALACAVKAFSLCPGVPSAPTLGAWMQRVRHEAPGCDPTVAVAMLNAQRFGASTHAPNVLKQAFYAALSQARPERPRARFLSFLRHHTS